MSTFLRLRTLFLSAGLLASNALRPVIALTSTIGFSTSRLLHHETPPASLLSAGRRVRTTTALIQPWPAAKDDYFKAYGGGGLSGGEQEAQATNFFAASAAGVPGIPRGALRPLPTSFAAVVLVAEPKANPMADFLKGAWNALDFSKIPGEGPLALLNVELTFVLSAAGLGPFAGLLTAALGLTAPSPMQPVLDKLVELQKEIDVIKGNLDQGVIKEHLQEQLGAWYTLRTNVTNIWQYVVYPNAQVYSAAAGDPDLKTIQKTLSEAFGTDKKLTLNNLAIFYQAFGRYDRQYPAPLSVTNLLSQLVTVTAGSDEYGLANMKNKFESLARKIGMISSQTGGLRDLLKNGPYEVYEYREMLNAAYRMYLVMLTIKQRAAMQWLLMGNDHIFDGNLDLTLDNFEENYLKVFTDAHDTYSETFAMIGKGYIGANRTTYCNLLDEGTLHQSLSGTLGYPPQGNITGHAFDIWKNYWPWGGRSTGNFYMDGDERNRGFLPIAPGQCKTFGPIGTFEGRKTYSINHSEMTIWYMSQGGPMFRKMTDIAFKNTNENWREIVVALTHCDVNGTPSLECSGKNWGGDFGALANSDAVKNDPTTQWMFQSMGKDASGKPYPSLVDSLKTLTKDEMSKFEAGLEMAKEQTIPAAKDFFPDGKKYMPGEVLCFIPAPGPLDLTRCVVKQDE